LDLTGLITRIVVAVISIDSGRKGFAIEGKEREGRISFEKGIASALAAFKEAQISADPYILIMAECTFIFQEMLLCGDTDKNAFSSLTQAKQNFDDALFALQVVENSSIYKEADKLFLHHKDYRIKGFPKDAFHNACNSHKTRLNNALRVFGIDPIEKTLIEQRIANMETAKNGYLEKQKKALLG